MKKIIFTFAGILALTMSACSNAVPVTESTSPAESSTLVADLVNQQLTVSVPSATQTPIASATVELTTDYENAVSIETQLLLGTIKLEGTESTVTTEQAGTLMPLWENFKTASESMMLAQGGGVAGQPNSTPQTQMDELVKQIQAAMTLNQIKAIAEMQITQEIVMTTLQEYGITMGGPQQGNGTAPGNGGQPPMGTPPADGIGGQPPDTGQMGTPPAAGMQSGMGMGFVSPELIDALIQILEKKTSS